MKLTSTVNGIATNSVGANAHPRDEPALFEKLAPLKRPPEHELDRVGRHREQPADGLHRPGEVARLEATPETTALPRYPAPLADPSRIVTADTAVEPPMLCASAIRAPST